MHLVRTAEGIGGLQGKALVGKRHQVMDLTFTVTMIMMLITTTIDYKRSLLMTATIIMMTLITIMARMIAMMMERTSQMIEHGCRRPRASPAT
jgi:hypothetical protein